MEIITVNDPNANVLWRKAKPVGKVTTEIHELIDQMTKTMNEAKGIGLAAPQVGVSKRVIVAVVEERPYVLVDPVIVKREGKEVDIEACLSIPGVVAEVPRAARIVVKAKSRRGRGMKLSAKGLLSRVLQHEIDHLDGILFLDRVVDKSTIREVAESAEVAPASG